MGRIIPEKDRLEVVRLTNNVKIAIKIFEKIRSKWNRIEKIGTTAPINKCS